MKWNRNILTDSGGFQMVSLSNLCEITEVYHYISISIINIKSILPFFLKSQKNLNLILKNFLTKMEI